MRRVAGLLLVISSLTLVPSTASAASVPVIGIWPQTYAQYTAIRAAAGIPIPYFRGRMRDGQFDSNLVPPDDAMAAAAGFSIGLNIQPKTGSGSNRTGILYTDISAQIQASSGPYYDKLVSMANEVLALPTYGVVPNYIEFHSEANIQAAPGVLDAHPYSGTGPEYQQCYALVHQLFQSLGVTNKIVWQIVLTRSAYVGNQGGPQNWFPSDPSLYDLVGVDAYYQAGQWLIPSSAFDTAFAFAQAAGKQVWIDETGADEGGPNPQSATAKAAWFGALDTYLVAHRASLAGVVFSHSADGGNWFLDSTFPSGRTVPNYSGTSWTAWKTAVTDLVTSVPPTRTLSVATTGTGSGAVTSSPGGINCGTTCSADFSDGASVVLTATPSGGSTFDGWAGACTGTGACNVTMNGVMSVSAAFSPIAQRLLSVTNVGNGAGTVIADSGGITCPGTCSASYDHGTVVALTATPDANVTFDGWGGDCSGTTACNVTMDQARNVTATFTLVQHALSLTTAGTGTGSITGTGITCPGTCSANYDHGTVVALTATPDANVTFDGWAGACTGTGACNVTMNGVMSVSAAFSPIAQRLLTLTKVGSGTGTITSNPAAISCPGTCGASFDDGAVVALTATPDANVTFDGWSGDCSGTTTCTVTMDQARNVTATFTLVQHALAVTKSGTGTGTITSNPAAISCPGTCGASFDHGTVVVLSAAPAAGSTFAGWSSSDGGFSCPGTGACTVTMDAGKNVTGTFTIVPRLLTVTKAGNGAGTVIADSGGISCPGTCSGTYASGTVVALSVNLGANSVFAGWGGDCAGTTTCTVTMDQARNVTATFTLVQHALAVTKSGTGTGTITSNPAAISCPGTCGASFDHGTSVALSAAPAPGSTFAGWSSSDTGFSCPGAGTCTVTMDAAKNVTGTFTIVQRLLTVTKAGNGAGTVSSDSGGISCPGTCSGTYASGTVVALSANLGANSVFTAWGGDCSGTGVCTVTMDQARSVSATFTLVQRALAVTKAGTGTGTITSNPAAISCPGTCGASFDHGTSVALSAAPAPGSTFAGWSSSDTGFSCPGAGTCTVTMDAAKNVTGTFTIVQRLLTVTKAGNGAGTVSSDSGGISCPGTCSGTYASGTVVALSANLGANSVFTGWGGDCSGTGAARSRWIRPAASAPPSRWPTRARRDEAGTGTGTITSNPAAISCPGPGQLDHGTSSCSAPPPQPDPPSPGGSPMGFLPGTGPHDDGWQRTASPPLPP